MRNIKMQISFLFGFASLLFASLSFSVFSATPPTPPGYATGGLFSVYFQNMVTSGDSNPSGVCPAGQSIVGFATGSTNYAMPVCRASTSGGYWTQSGTSLFYTGGNVGIGKTNPATNLDVSGSIAAHVYYFNTGDSAPLPGWDTNFTWTWAGNNIYNLNTGNIGINKTTPTYTLDISGSLNIGTAGDFTLNNKYLSYKPGGVACTNDQILAWSGTLSPTPGFVCASDSAGITSVGLTTNYVTKWNGTKLVNSRIFDDGSNVGVGTTSPTTTLDILSRQTSSAVHPYRAGLIVSASGSDVGGRIGIRSAGSIEAPYLIGYRSRGTLEAPTAVQAGDYIMGLAAIPYDGTNWFGGAGMYFSAEENWNATNHGSNIGFATTNPGAGGTNTIKMTITGNGNILAGLSASKNYGGTLQIANGAQVFGANSTTNATLVAADYNAYDATPTWSSAVVNKFAPSQVGNLYVASSVANAGWAEFAGINANGMAIGTNNSAPIIIGTSGAERMRIDATGNVGIGTSSPSAKLDVAGSFYSQGGGLVLRDQGVANEGGEIFFNGQGTNNGILMDNLAGNLRIYSANATANKDLLIANFGTAFSMGLNVQGNVTAAGFFYSSDKSLKKNLTPIKNSLSRLLKLNGYSFEWKKDGKRDMGVVAQEVEEVFPEIVSTNHDTGLKTVEYGNLTAPIIEAIREQQNQINNQQKEIEALKQQIEALTLTK